jgi:hypothetical protein
MYLRTTFAVLLCIILGACVPTAPNEAQSRLLQQQLLNGDNIVGEAILGGAPMYILDQEGVKLRSMKKEE